MEIEIIDMPEVEPKKHPLLVESKFPANILGKALFVQLISGLNENPVRFVLHDRFSGMRKMVVVKVADTIVETPMEKAHKAFEKAAEQIREVSAPMPVSAPAAMVPRSPKVIPSPTLAPKAPPAPTAVVSRVSAPPPTAPKLSVPGKPTVPKPPAFIKK